VIVSGNPSLAVSTPAAGARRSVGDICADLDIEIVPTAARRGASQSCASQTMRRILDEHGEGHLILVLRSIVETGNNRGELVAPTIWAISDLIRAHPSWVAKGLGWLEALDRVDLGELRSQAKANRRAVAPRRALATMLYQQLRPIFEPESQGRMI
jgi:hypothetical protein